MDQHVLFEFAVTRWRFGSSWSERMCARYLAIQGYSDIIPQSPLGGPDGGKDIRFSTPIGSGIAACYFPPTEAPFTRIKKKFVRDLKGALANEAKIFYFLTGQRLSVGEEDELRSSSPVETVIVDVDALLVYEQSLRSFLDGSQQPKLDEGKRTNDVGCLRLIIANCDFFNILHFTDQAPDRFRSGLTDRDCLIELFTGGRIHFYDELLNAHVATWWEAWNQLVYLVGWSFDLNGSGGIYYPVNRHYPEISARYCNQYELAKMQSYLASVGDAAEDFREAYNALLRYCAIALCSRILSGRIVNNWS